MSFAEQKFRLLQRLNNSNYLIIYFDEFSMANSLLLDMTTLELTSITPELSHSLGFEVDLGSLEPQQVQNMIMLSDVLLMNFTLISFLGSNINLIIECIQELQITMNVRTATNLYFNVLSLKQTAIATFLADLEFDINTTLASNLLVNSNPTTSLAIETLSNISQLSGASFDLTTLEYDVFEMQWSAAFNSNATATFMFVMNLIFSMLAMTTFTEIMSQLQPSSIQISDTSNLDVSSTLKMIVDSTLATHDNKQLVLLDYKQLLDMNTSILLGPELILL